MTFITHLYVVGPRARGTASHVIPRKILHPVSLMGDYHESVQLALKIARTYWAELTLLHVLDETRERVNPERTAEWAKHELNAFIPAPRVPDAAAPGATDEGPSIRTRVTSGELVEEILKTATEINADWIVLGADGAPRSWSFKAGLLKGADGGKMPGAHALQ